MAMADLVALIAAVCWGGANMCIARGAGGKGEDNGAFLSILITATIAALVWVVAGWGAAWTLPAASSIAWFALAGALTIFIGRVFLHASIQWLGGIRGASVKRLSPLFSVLLGVVLLHEPLSRGLVLGMVLIFGGFGLLVLESMQRAGLDSSSGPAAASARRPAWVNPGLALGAVSALAYAAGNIARKYGLHGLPDPAFGAMLGSLVGALLFVVTARFVTSYRVAVHSTFSRVNPWLLGAGILASVGQLLFFVAIDRGTVSRAALIVSSEVFLTMALTRWLTPGREHLSRLAVVAAVLGVAGTVLIISDSVEPVIPVGARPLP